MQAGPIQFTSINAGGHLTGGRYGIYHSCMEFSMFFFDSCGVMIIDEVSRSVDECRRGVDMRRF